MLEWSNPKRGYYIARYQGRTLEIVRNTDSTDKRRYVAFVDSVMVSQPCYTIPQAKTKAMKWASSPVIDVVGESHGPPEPAANNAVVPYVDPALPSDQARLADTAPDNPVMMEFRIVGKIPSDQFARAIAHLKATVDMLRDEGAIAECDIEPPARVKL